MVADGLPRGAPATGALVSCQGDGGDGGGVAEGGGAGATGGGVAATVQATVRRSLRPVALRELHPEGVRLRGG